MTDTRTLWTKLAEVSAELESLPKDRTANMGSYSYSYISEEQLMEAIRAKLSSRNVAVTVSWDDASFNGNLAVVRGHITFVNGDSPDERERVGLLGSGTDKSDKAIPKAMTAATRYGLWKTFLIPAGEVDSEQEHVERVGGQSSSGW